MRRRHESRRSEKLASVSKALDILENHVHKQCGVCLLEDPTKDTKFFSWPQMSCADDILLDIDSLQEESRDSIDWLEIPSALDPAAGELDSTRAARKRAQIQALVLLVEGEISQRKTEAADKITSIVEFGSGSGHLGLILAFRNPQIHVILAERKEYSVCVARERITACNLINNVLVFDQDVRDLDIAFDIGISLHSCGLLTDIALEMCVKAGASFVITPCCYGQIVKPPPPLVDSNEKPNIVAIESTRSSAIIGLYPDQLPNLASGADFSVDFDFERDVAEHNSTFILAKRCMRVIDFDRALRVCEKTNGDFICKLSSIRPLVCTPKNNVIIGRKRKPKG